MKPLKYKLIKSKKQYKEYCKILEKITDGKITKPIRNEVALLTWLIKQYDRECGMKLNLTLSPIKVLKSLMEYNDMKQKDLVELLGVSKGLVSDILNYKKGLSKDVIRILSKRFKVRQEAFNRPYKLKK